MVSTSSNSIEELLGQNSHSLIETLNNLQDGVFALNKEWSLTFVNKKAAEFIGLVPKDLMGKNYWQAFPLTKGTRYEVDYKKAVETQQIINFEDKSLYSDRYFQVTIYPSHEGIIVVLHDITERKKIEGALFESNELLNNIVNNSDDVIIARDLNEKLILLNDAQARNYKMPKEKAIGTTPYDIYSKQVAEYLVASDQKIISSDKSARYEETVPVNGVERTFITNKFPLHDAEGKIYGVGAVITEITERKKAEQAFEKANEQTELEKKRLQTLLETTPSAVVVVEAPDGRFSFMNKRALALYGIDYTGVNLETNVAKIKATKPDGRVVTVEEVPASRALWKGEIVRNEEWIIYQADGTPIPVLVSAAPIRNAKGQIVSAVVIFEDITKRKKTEEALKESEALYRTVFDNSADGFQLVKPIFDEKGKPLDYLFLQVNKAYEQQVGLKAEQVVGKTVREIVPNIEPEWIETHGQVAKTGKSLHKEIYNDFSKRWYDLYYFRYKEGQVGVLFRDITARKDLEILLKDQERLAAIGQTAGMVGHDIRNPLQAIVGDLYLLKDDVNTIHDEKIRESAQQTIEGINENLAYINKIIADLQDYARDIKPSLSQVSLKDVIDDAFSTINVPSNIDAVCNVEPNTTLKTDPSYIRRIITNLSINAIQAMPNGGKLTINVRQKEGLIEITVVDTGQGIPEEIKDKMFKPLFTTKSKGQGFGLAVVKKFVEQLGGTITFESQQGKGTAFILKLPAS